MLSCKFCTRGAILAGILSGLMGIVAQGAEGVPARLQAALFNKILKYDNTLKSKTSFTIAVIDSEGSAAGAREISKEFRNLGLTVLNVKNTDLNPAATVAALYFVNNDRIADIKRFCTEHGILSMTGEPNLVQGGHASVGLSVGEDKKIQVWVNLQRLRHEAHDLSAQLLSMAQIVK